MRRECRQLSLALYIDINVDTSRSSETSYTVLPVAEPWTRFCSHYKSHGEHSFFPLYMMIMVIMAQLGGCLSRPCSEMKKLGSGRHTYYMTKKEILLTSTWNYTAAPFWMTCFAIPKLAIVLFLQRIWVKRGLSEGFCIFCRLRRLLFSPVKMSLLSSSVMAHFRLHGVSPSLPLAGAQILLIRYKFLRWRYKSAGRLLGSDFCPFPGWGALNDLLLDTF